MNCIKCNKELSASEEKASRLAAWLTDTSEEELEKLTVCDGCVEAAIEEQKEICRSVILRIITPIPKQGMH